MDWFEGEFIDTGMNMEVAEDVKHPTLSVCGYRLGLSCMSRLCPAANVGASCHVVGSHGTPWAKEDTLDA